LHPSRCSGPPETATVENPPDADRACR
jgi:hypothetical protein